MKTGRPPSLPVSYVDDEIRDYSGRRPPPAPPKEGGNRVCPYGWMRLFIHYSFFDTLLLLMVKQQPFLPLTYEYGQVSLAHVPLMVS